MKRKLPAKGRDFDVLVMGAGASGLAAAMRLAEGGFHVALVEARERIGGRIHTVAAKSGGLPIELGAEFLHGLSPELLELIEEAGLTRFELEGEHLHFHGGRLQPSPDRSDIFRLFQELSQSRTDLLLEDLSFTEWIARKNLSPQSVLQARNYVEGFNAAEADRISVLSLADQQRAENAISGDRTFRIAEGYARIPESLLRRFLSAGGEFFPSMPAASVRWARGSVELRTTVSGAPIFQAGKAVITVPLGVLQARTLDFQPLPGKLLDAADRLRMGAAARVVFEFDPDFWKESSVLKGVSFLFAPEEPLPTWWTSSPRKSALLTGWVGGPRTKSAAIDALPEMGLVTISKILALPFAQVRSHLEQCHMHHWEDDPCTLGAYSYVPKGGIDASDELSRPVEETLFFAGEHTAAGYWGTVHGAIRSGYRAAAQAMQAGSPTSFSAR